MLERVRRILSNFKNRISQLIEKYQLFSVSKNNIKRYLLALIILSAIIITITSSFAATVPVKSVEIKSEKLNYDKKEQGAWKVTKSASWTSKNKARITFDVDTIEKSDDKDKDIILVIDNSNNMNDKSINVRNKIMHLFDKLKLETKNNRVSYIVYSDAEKTKIISDFTQDTETLKKIIPIKTTWFSSTNSSYYQAFTKVNELLENYSYNENKQLTIIFFTAGSPTIDSTKEVKTYNKIKQEYPYASVKSIQYEAGDEILDVVKNVSDIQYIANEDNLDDILYKAIFGISLYKKFNIVDSINDKYFNIDKAEASSGTISIDNNNINWNAPTAYNSGNKAQITIDLTLKDDYQNNEKVSLFELTNSTKINTSIDDTEENISSNSTPILKSKYTVTYDINAPSGCSASSVPSPELYYVFDSVSINTSTPECFGYQFKGWKINDKDITQPSSASFIMPEKDVTVKATWSKVWLTKSTTGKVAKRASLYNVIEGEALSGGLAKEYTGEHQDSLDREATHKIYHYYASNDEEGNAIQNKNNVIFAGFCWQMIRTTDTGGVKMIYNGVPDSSGNCGKNRGNHVGYNSETYINLTKNYYYGTDFTYNPISRKFSISGEKIKATWSDDTASSLFGKYTCISTSETAECETMYQIHSKYSSNSAYVLPINSNTQYSGIGTAEFTMSLEKDFLDSGDEPFSYLGYLNIGWLKVSPKFKQTESKHNNLLSSRTVSTSDYYGTNYTNILTYVIKNPITISDDYDYTKLVGMYTTLSTKRSQKLYRIVAVNGNTIYYCENDNYSKIYNYGDSYTMNSDGTYALNNPKEIKVSEWYNKYENINDKYICASGSASSCKTVQYVSNVREDKYYYFDTSENYKYANGYTYENDTYTLDDDSVTFWNRGDENNVKQLNNHHYTCLNETGTCTELYYVYHASNTYFYAVNITENNLPISSFDTILNSNFFLTNEYIHNSVVKSIVESWYEKNMIDYSSYLEETIFCLDREIKDQGGWNPDGGDVSKGLTFKGKNPDNDLTCKNSVDKLSTSMKNVESLSFQPLPYSIGLLTSSEVSLLNNKNAIKSGANYWLISPSFYSKEYIDKNIYDGCGNEGIIGQTVIKADGSLSYTDEDSTIAEKNLIRPAISLKPNTKYSKGDGSYTNPYIVDTSE